jgi:16S rRNA A1518/A1519 N6-dimethyltransferase RsmA/KsgA/DIM1 with predicted DNA glycosylase/AP lyase activity
VYIAKQELAELMTSCGIKPTARAEELTLDDCLKIVAGSKK